MSNVEIIKQLIDAMAANEAKLAEVNATHWVILWDGSALKTDGNKVSLLGTKVYSGNRAMMERDAAKWLAQIGPDAGAVKAMPAVLALAEVHRINQELLASINK